MIVRQLGLRDYVDTWQAMQQFTLQRTPETPDELWLLEHPPVYTLGQAGKHEHILNAKNIPVIQTDRGGQVTYHGPGQLIAYILFDVKRNQMNLRQLVTHLEKAVINTLATYDVIAHAKPEAPGIYVGEAKIASLGLRIRRGYSYHGLALNIDMDLAPFSGINPCGYKGLAVTQLRDFVPSITLQQVAQELVQHF